MIITSFSADYFEPRKEDPGVAKHNGQYLGKSIQSLPVGIIETLLYEPQPPGDIFVKFCCQVNPTMITPQRTEEIQNTLETNDLDEHTELKHTLYFIFIHIILPSPPAKSKS